MAVSETRDLDVPGGFELFGPDGTIFDLNVVLIASCSLSGVLLASERTEFSLKLSIPLGSPDGTLFCCK